MKLRQLNPVAALTRKVMPRSLLPGEQADLTEHLDELRGRLVISLLSFGAAFVVAYIYHKDIIRALNSALPASAAQPLTFGIAEPFMTSIKVSLWAAFMMSLPVFLWQLWGFFAPAVDGKRRKGILVAVGSGTLLFAAGVSFAYFIALPSAVKFLTAYDADLYNVQVRAKDFYLFSMAVLASVGLVFELPVVMLTLVRFRVLSSGKLRKNRKLCYLALTALAVLLPGVDPVLTVMELVPLAILFEITILLSGRFERKWERERIMRQMDRESDPTDLVRGA